MSYYVLIGLGLLALAVTCASILVVVCLAAGRASRMEEAMQRRDELPGGKNYK